MDVHWLVVHCMWCSAYTNFEFEGNYDVSKMHYEGPGEVPGSTGGGYGYDVRTGPATVVVP